MAEKAKERSKSVKFLIAALSVLLTILAIWLLGFIMDDIGSLPGPQLATIEERYLDPGLVAKRRSSQEDLAQVAQLQRNEKEKQSLLRDSTDGSKETMNQLLEMQRLGLEKGVKPTQQEQAALADSERIFLDNQQQYQQCNEKLTGLSERQRSIEEEARALDVSLNAQRAKASAEHQRVLTRHNLKLAALKLLVLIPLLFLSVLAFLRWRHTLYAPFVYSAGIAVLFEVVMVMHEHFPARYFKYLLLLAALALVVRVLVYVLKLAVAPKSEEWKLQAVREAYRTMVCPACAFPVKPGALRVLLSGAAAGAADACGPYTCPACGTKVYERCSQCGGLRHSKLPFCEQCGAREGGRGGEGVE